jgi:radical SAM superfamily enzyme YgiQ (UPF0313 family)
MKNIYLFQPQYSVDYRKEKNYWIPYSVGCVWSYCNQFDDIKHNFSLRDIIFKREDHESILDKLDNPRVCAFGCYQWNKNYNFSLAKKIKDKWPTCAIIFGGPEITITTQDEYFIDCIILGEGEQSFLTALREISDGKELTKIFQKQRSDNLSYMPSPYTTGIFDKIIKDNPGVKWATTLETNRGCPFSCTFCDWGSLTYSKVKKFDLSRVAEDLDWIAKNPIAYIFCADANFGIFKQRDLDIAKLVSETGKKNPGLEAFNATFNKNNNEWSFEILTVLGALNRGFTVSVQSLHQPTLKAIKRDNMGINDLTHIFDLCQQNAVHSYTELILGLPNETCQSFSDGLCQLLEMGQHSHIEVWFVDLLVNSELASPMDRINYGIKTVKTSNYLALLNKDEQDPWSDEIELVCATNTMSTEEMISSYMYAWIIVNFHMQGYSQLASRFCRNIHNIKYMEFYNKLIDEIIKHPILSNVYTEAKQTVSGLLYNGVLPNTLSGHNLIFALGESIYKNKHLVFDVIDSVLDQLVPNSNQIKQLHRHSVYDIDTMYPVQVEVDFNIELSDTKQTSYVVTPMWDGWKNRNLNQNFDDIYYALRRKGVLKNILMASNK